MVCKSWVFRKSCARFVVIVTSMNEGKFRKISNSFIPYDVKRELGLPTFKERHLHLSFFIIYCNVLKHLSAL
jgi:hypothetical protein